MKRSLASLALLGALLSTSCVTTYDRLEEFPGAVESPYFEKVQELRAGMTRDEVVEILGEPEIERVFSDIWMPVEGHKTNQIKVLYSGATAVRATWLRAASNARYVIFG